ncbi:MAG TPA: SDR family NAD(P)-dependent oxidoreductase [Stellaceae bacterium]|nr:SDR family NAD(P)-dependent oxidoreductase [Stellaceae bacterium]
MSEVSKTKPALRGQHAIVTGASRGIGLAIALALGEAGASVTLIGRDRAALSAAAERIGTQAIAAVADLADPAQIDRAIAEGRAAFGPVRLLVNNAGIAKSAPFGALALEDWSAMLAVNLTAVFHACRAVLPEMVARRDGRIITIASTAGLKGYAYTAGYCASKHGAIGLTRALALETARDGVTVNAVCPGFTDTDMASEAIETIQAKTGRNAETARADLEKFNPQRRLIDPREIASTVLWLCSPGSEGITGQSIAVAGGEVM